MSFRGYYRPTEDEFSYLWENCIFVPDANVLLNIYRYSPTTCNSFISIFKEIAEHLWVPHQAALEYHKQRLNVIQQQESAYEKVRESLDTFQKKIEIELNSFKRHPFINAKYISEKIKGTLIEIEHELDGHKNDHPKLLDSAWLRDEITILFENRVGSSYSPEKLKGIYKNGKERYENKIPPGFRDKKKGNDEQFGDLVLWLQIIDYAKSIERPIIFITDDGKEDWWLKFNGKTIGPRPELIDEMYTEANVNFYMYQTEQFMACAEKYLKHTVDKEAIKEVQEIKQYDEEYVKLLNQIKSEKFRDLANVNKSFRDFAKIDESIMNYAKIDGNIKEFAKVYGDFRCFKENIGDFAVINEKLKQVKKKQESEND